MATISRLIGLSPEIRRIVYDHVFENNVLVVEAKKCVSGETQSQAFHVLITDRGLSLTCRLIHEETTAYLSQAILLRWPCNVQHLVDLIPARVLASIKTLYVDHVNPMLAFPKDCFTSLRQIVLLVEEGYMGGWRIDGYPPATCDMDDENVIGSLQAMEWTCVNSVLAGGRDRWWPSSPSIQSSAGPRITFRVIFRSKQHGGTADSPSCSVSGSIKRRRTASDSCR